MGGGAIDVWRRRWRGWLVGCGWSPGVRVRRVKGKALSSIASGISGSGSMVVWVEVVVLPARLLLGVAPEGFMPVGEG